VFPDSPIRTGLIGWEGRPLHNYGRDPARWCETLMICVSETLKGRFTVYLGSTVM
jgi:hypothetical protein